jgi:ATP-dependent Clp protease ATP-binding subunit ClpA
MGARPMARLIQDTIRSALADELLFGRLANGGHVTVDLDDNDKVKLVFEEETADAV